MHRLALILLAVSACVAAEGDEGFSIVHNLAPGADKCELMPGGAFRSSGRIEAGSDSGYLLTPEFTSRIRNDEGSEAQRTIALRGARIEVFNVTGATGGGTSIDKFTSLFAASLSPMGSTTAAFDIVRPQTLASLPQTGETQLRVKVTPYGALGGGGDEIEGVPFEYPVKVCTGCVLINGGLCPLPAGTGVGAINPCNPTQDAQAICCQESNGLLLCPGRTM